MKIILVIKRGVLMAKFFDLNKGDTASKPEPEKEIKLEEHTETEKVKVEAEDSPKTETAPPIEHGSYTAPENHEEDPEKPAEHPKHESDDEDKKSPEEDQFKTPDIPRVTASMAPESRPASKSISSSQHLSSTNTKQKWVTALLTIVLLGLLGVLIWQAYIFYNSSVASKTTETATTSSSTPAITKITTTSATTTASETPVVTTSSDLTKANVSVKILNGNGVTGSANTASTAVKAAGFTVASTSNAKSFTYATSTVYYKDATGKTVADQLVSSLTTYSVVSKLDATVATTVNELVFVVGKK
jgi:hypothetical protein